MMYGIYLSVALYVYNNLMFFKLFIVIVYYLFLSF